MKSVSTKNVTSFLASVILMLAARAMAGAFEPQPWIDDLGQVKEALATKYANLEWAVFEREVDLQRLFAETQERIEHATSEAEARAAFDRLARHLGDGHVRFDWPHGAAVAASPARDQCAALGYDARMRATPVGANAVGYQPLSTSESSEFPAGLLSVNGQRVGVVQIGVFTPQGFPALCQAALQALAVPAQKSCDDACGDRIESWASGRLTLDLAAQLRALQAAGAGSLVVDVAANGGGTEWAEAVARMLTPLRLQSERAGFVRGDHWAKAFADDEAALRRFAAHASGRDRAVLLKLADEVEAKRRTALTPCDSAPLWRREHPACSWLGEAFFGSGMLAAADPSALRGKPWATRLFSPMEFPYEEGVWRGPLIVLVDRNTGSAASEFAAVLQDNHAAIVMGETADGGCGHTNSGATLEVPDCARFRRDGSNEVMGIQPDVPVSFGAVDGPHRRGALFLAQLPVATERAVALRN
jgi:Peptidase family S41